MLSAGSQPHFHSAFLSLTLYSTRHKRSVAQAFPGTCLVSNDLNCGHHSLNSSKVHQAVPPLLFQFVFQGIAKKKVNSCQSSLLKADLLTAHCATIFHKLYSQMLYFVFLIKIWLRALSFSTWHIQWTDSKCTRMVLLVVLLG